MERIKEVAFINESCKKAYLKLKEGKFEEKQLYDFISRAIDDLKSNPFCGIKIQTKLIPEKYIKEYEVENLWKYNLPNAWRLLYTIAGNQIKIVSVILNWMNHKDYERLFKF
jgi:Txe/YoeB family toxin of Txe-Axe toxin-antitoxin module